MSLKETIKKDFTAAMKAGDRDTKSTVSMLLAAIKNRELEKRSRLAKEGTSETELNEASILTDEEVVDTVASEIKKRKEAVATYEEAGRPEAAESEKREIDVLTRYLPEQMSEDEVMTLITEAIAQTGAASPADMGKVMGVVAPKTKGRFDGKRLSELVKDALSG